MGRFNLRPSHALLCQWLSRHPNGQVQSHTLPLWSGMRSGPTLSRVWDQSRRAAFSTSGGSLHLSSCRRDTFLPELRLPTRRLWNLLHDDKRQTAIDVHVFGCRWNENWATAQSQGNQRSRFWDGLICALALDKDLVDCFHNSAELYNQKQEFQLRSPNLNHVFSL